MFHIQTLNKISPVGLNKFDPANYTVDAPETTPDAIMVRSASMHDMEMPESLLAIARAGAVSRASWSSTPPAPTPTR